MRNLYIYVNDCVLRAPRREPVEDEYQEQQEGKLYKILHDRSIPISVSAVLTDLMYIFITFTASAKWKIQFCYIF